MYIAICDSVYKHDTTKLLLDLQVRDQTTTNKKQKEIFLLLHTQILNMLPSPINILWMGIFCSQSLSLSLTHHKPKSWNLPYTDYKIGFSGNWKFDLIKFIFLPNESPPSSQRTCFNQPKRRKGWKRNPISSILFSIWPNCTAAKCVWAGSQQRLLGNRVWSKGSLPPLFPSDQLKHTAGLLGNSETQTASRCAWARISWSQMLCFISTEKRKRFVY